MSLSRPVDPITASDDELRAALADAELPPLLAALAHLSGDRSILRDELRPNPMALVDAQGGLGPERQAEARELALDVLRTHRDAGSPAPPRPTRDELWEIVSWVGAGTITEEYLPLVIEELALDGVDERAPTWRRDEIAPDTPFTVAIVGAGMSGLLAAHRFDQAGIDWVILEKNDDVGGTWLENTYPGCRVDVPNHLYSYSFAQKEDWVHHYSAQPTLLEYFRTFADEYGLRDRIRFRTEVVEARWSDETSTWTVEVRRPDGSVDHLEVNAVVSAVGQLNRPSMPTIAGMDRFAGPAFHSARWDHDVDLTGKRVAVIGTGASAVQAIPAIADQVAHLDVYQRTPPWLAPTRDYHDEVEPGMHWLFRHVPGFRQWYRFWLFWRMAELMLPAAKVDPSWEPQERSVSQLNELSRQVLAAYLEDQFKEAPELLSHVVPDYPPAAKRMLRDNGIWASTLTRDDVELVTEKISEITQDGITTADGVDHPADVIVYGTGFTASRFLTPMRVVGRDGIDLHQEWDGDARAYLGITVPKFPNLFLLYGPNTNIVVNGSIIYFSECETHYVLEAIRALLADGKRALDPKPEVHDEYNARVDEGNLAMAWGVSTVNSWYRNEKGRSAQNWPFTLLEYWQQTREVDLDDYVVK